MKINMFIEITKRITSTVKRLIKISSIIYSLENCKTLAEIRRTTHAYIIPIGSRINSIFKGVAKSLIRFQSIIKVEFEAVRSNPYVPVQMEDSHRNGGAIRNRGYIVMITDQKIFLKPQFSSLYNLPWCIGVENSTMFNVKNSRAVSTMYPKSVWAQTPLLKFSDGNCSLKPRFFFRTILCSKIGQVGRVFRRTLHLS